MIAHANSVICALPWLGLQCGGLNQLAAYRKISMLTGRVERVGQSRRPPEIVYPDRDHEATCETGSRAGKLEGKPFLESLPVYRYLPEHR